MTDPIPFILWLGMVLLLGGAIIKDTSWYEKPAIKGMIQVIQVLTLIILAVVFIRDILQD